MSTNSEGYGDTPATSADPEVVAEGDTDQLDTGDTLLDRGTDNILDEGIVTAEKPTSHRLETELEQYEGESLDERLEQEEPEVWQTADGPDAGAREADRAGRLAAADAEDSTGLPAADVFATDVGIDGGAASAEEAAVHVIDPDDAAGGSDRL